MAQKKASFSGHEKFECKTSWIPKALQVLKENQDILKSTNGDQAIAQLGLGNNMVKSLRHWLLVFNLYDKNVGLTKLGEIIFENDPYLESIDTLWILHIILSEKMESATLYYLIFNYFYRSEFTKDSLMNELQRWNEKNAVKVSDNTLISDIDVFIRMYKVSSNEGSFSDSLFSELNLLHQVDEHFELNFKTPIPISDEAFLATFLYVIQDKAEKTLAIKDLQYGGHYNLQNMLLMTDEQFITRLERLEEMTDGKIVYREAAGLKQVYIDELIDWEEYLPSIYGEQK